VTDPNAIKRRVAEIFDHAAPIYDQAASSYFRHFAPLLVERVHLSPESKILDIACGKGAVLLDAAKRIGERGTAIGVDISSAMVSEVIRRVSRRRLHQVSACVMDAEQLAFTPDTFDAVFFAFSLHFLPAPEHAAAEFSRVLRPGGRIALSEWGEDDPRWTWEDELKASFVDLPPLGSATFDMDLERLLKEAGFVDVSVADEELVIHLADEDEWWRWKWSYSFRRALEAMDAESLKDFRRAAYEKLRSMREPNGIPLRLQALFATGRKPDAGPGPLA
jgi:ubiquinone/menaquinone biosynthesis C-methylase UbiE